MAHAVVFLPDDHVGSRYGLWKRDAHLDDGLDKVRGYILECNDHARTVWLPSIVGTLPTIVHLPGDIVDGISPKALLCTDDEEEQIMAARDLLLPWCAGAEQVRGVAGTEFHAGKGAKYDNTVCALLGAVPDETGRYARLRDWFCVDGVTLDVAHHVGGSYVPASRATPLTREYVSAAMNVFEHDWPKPDYIIRAHSHRYRCVPYDTATVITLPSWQAATPYTAKISREAGFDIGLVVLVVDEGRAEMHVKLYRWPTPHVESIGWTPQNQNPHSDGQSGPPCLASQAKPSRLTSIFRRKRSDSAGA